MTEIPEEISSGSHHSPFLSSTVPSGTSVAL